MLAAAATAAATLLLACVAVGSEVAYRDAKLRFTGTQSRDEVTVVQVKGGYDVLLESGRLELDGSCERRTRRRARCTGVGARDREATVALGPAADHLTVTTASGGAGKLLARGGTGKDSLAVLDKTEVTYLGQAGNDVLAGPPRSRLHEGAVLHGGRGRDKIIGGAGGGGELRGGPGGDWIRPRGGTDNYVFGGPGDDHVSMNDGAGQAHGGDGNDHLVGGTIGLSYLDGGAGDDTIDASVDPGRDRIRCGPGLDTVTLEPQDVFENGRRDEAAAAAAGCENVTQL